MPVPPDCKKIISAEIRYWQFCFFSPPAAGRKKEFRLLFPNYSFPRFYDHETKVYVSLLITEHLGYLLNRCVVPESECFEHSMLVSYRHIGNSLCALDRVFVVYSLDRVFTEP